MRDASRLITAAVLGAAIAFTASAVSEQVRDKPPKPEIRAPCVPDSRAAFDSEQRAREQLAALERINERLSALEHLVEHVELLLQFPAHH